MANRVRNHQIIFRVTEHERELIEQKMQQIGVTNMQAYLRKMAIDGYALTLDLSELKEMNALLRRCSNNINQIAKRLHETGRIYDVDIADVQEMQKSLWEALNKLLLRLSEFSC